MRERLQERIIERRRDARQALQAEFGPPWWTNPGAIMRSGLPKDWKTVDISDLSSKYERVMLGDYVWKDGANAKENT